LDEYRKHIEKDAALERRFQPVQVDEPSMEDTVTILRGLRDKYEAHHRVSYTDEALKAAASLSDRYINDRFLPDKAVDLLDEAGARMRIKRMTAPKSIRDVDDRIAEVRKEKEAAIDAQDFEKAAGLRDTERKLHEERSTKEKQWRSGDLEEIAEITEDHIAEVLAHWTGIPVLKLTEKESSRLLNMEDELHKRIIGQNEAVKAVSRAIRRTRAGLKDPRRPSGSFIFAGPSGVGKTELSKALANFLFGSDDDLIQIDMGEFHDRFTASRLFGAPPGYVGYEEGGQLTEKVRRKPFSVVLFDEIEKAHKEIYNTLLQVLEDGRLTDGQGRVVDFKNTVLIFTSNLGTQDISKAVGLGFTSSNETDSDAQYDRMKNKVNDELKKHFRPEFLNRIDEIVVFHQLTRDEIVQMVELLIGRVEVQLAERDMGIELTQKAKDLLAKRGFDPVLGARPLRRTIQREIEDQLSEKILYGEIGAGEIISVDVEGWDGESKDNTKATFTFSPRPKPLPEGTFDEPLEDTEVRDNDGADAESADTIIPDTLPEEPVSSSNDDGNNPPPAGAGAPSGQ
ncbi:ATP-dependent Clp protease ATP-binding subunit, partial [Corynebacterium stationis]|uniref:ATP-dependent Clp protease ATP-binding subunit n=1 Tax=Corynebacterium stationis TaxID=1705 RepID=UPI001749E073